MDPSTPWRDAHPACELAVLATRPDPLPDDDRLRDRIARVADWEQFRRLATDHGVAGLMHARLGALIAERCPADIWRRWREACRAESLENLRRVGDLARIVQDFERERLSVLAIKGPLLGMFVYGDLGSRPFGDLDLVVHPDDRERAIVRLCALGYAPRFALSGVTRRRYVRRYTELDLIHARTGTVVDLHWELLSPRYGFDAALTGYWDRAATVAVGTTPVRTLGAEDLLVHLLIHAAKHEWRCLAWLGDIARVIATGAVCWEGIACAGERSRSSRLIATGLEISSLLLEVPDRALLAATGLASSSYGALAREVSRRLLHSPEVDRPRHEWPWRRVFFRALEGWRDRLRWAHEIVLDPTPLEWQAVPLPRQLDWLYPLVRAHRLVRKHAWPAVRGSLPS